MSVATSQTCSQCGASLARGICPACALSDLLPDHPIPASSEQLDQAFGRYTLKERIAAGGMGIVYRAVDDTLRRTVALKMIRGATFANDAEFARFTIETEAAAALDHPHITPVYEVGVLEEQPFFTMKLISGASLSDWLKSKERPSTRTLVGWLKSIAEAVQHAHERGVLHRDLKPGNVLIDASDKPWLTDFGLAKMVHQESGLTLSSDRLGTPHYMAPEILSDTAHAASVASDIWALGVILWECLTGKLPFQGKNPLEVMRLIGESEPSNDATVDRDLLTLAQRCLEKDPQRRVGSAGLLAEELGRWLDGEPLQVRPVTSGERLWKWAKRNPAWSALAAVFVLASLSSVASWQRAERAVDSLTETNTQLTQSLATASATQLAMNARLEVEVDASRALLLAAESVDMSKRSAGTVLSATAEALYETMQAIGGTDLIAGDFHNHMNYSGYISRAPSRDHPLQFTNDQRHVLVLNHNTSPHVTAAGYDLHVSPPQKLFEFPIFPHHEEQKFQAVRWLAESLRLAAVEPTGTVTLWDPLASGGPAIERLGSLARVGERLFRAWIFPVERDDHFKGVAFYSNERDPSRNSAVFFTVKPGESETLITAPPQPIMDWEGLRGALWMASPSRRWFYVQAIDHVCLVKANPDNKTIHWKALPKERSMDEAVTFSADEQTLIHQSDHCQLRHLDLSLGDLNAVVASSTPFLEHPRAIDAFDISADGQVLAFADNAGDIFVTPLDDPTSPRWVKSGDERWHRLRFSSDSRWLGAGGVSPSAIIWPLAEDTAMPEGKPTWYRGLNTPVLDLLFTSNQQGMIAYGASARARYWNFDHGKPGNLPTQSETHDGPVTDLALSPDREWCVVACRSALANGKPPFIKLVRQRDGMARGIDRHNDNGPVNCAFSKDGQWLASAGADGIVKVWQMPLLVDSFEKQSSLPAPTYHLDTTNARLNYVRRMAFHPAGRLYVTCGDGYIFEWDLTIANIHKTLKHHHLHSINYLLPDVAVSKSGRWLAVARHGWDHRQENQVQYGNMVLLYDVSDPNTLDFQAALPAHFLAETTIAFSDDERWLAAGGARANVWDLEAPDIEASGKVSPMTDHLMKAIGFSPGGEWLAVGAGNGRLHLWDWQSSDLRIIHANKAVTALTWQTNTQLITGNASGEVAQWETDVALLSEQARANAGRELTQAERQRFRIH